MDNTKKFRPADIFRNAGRLFTYDTKHAVYATLAAAFTTVPWYLAQLVSGLTMKVATEGATRGEPVWGMVLVLALMYTFCRLPSILGFRWQSWAAHTISSKLKLNMVEKWISQDETYSRDHHTASVMARVLTDGESIGEFFFQGAGLTIVEPFVAGISALITIMAVDLRLTAYLLIVGLLSAACSALFSKPMHTRTNVSAAKIEAATHAFSNLLSGALTIKMLGIEKKIARDFGETAGQAASAAEKETRISLESNLVLRFFEIVGLAGCLLLAAYFSSTGDFYFPNVMIVLPMQALLSNMLAGLGKAWNCLTQISVPYTRVNEIIEIKTENSRADLPELSQNADVPFFECRDIHFEYERGKPVLGGISFDINKGEKVAIVGTSGGGKTTLFGLVLGYFTPASGSIKMMGTDLSACSLASWRENLALVSQESPLMDMSIADNIALGVAGSGRTPNRDEIENAAKLAGAHEFIIKLENGYDSQAGECASSLSGGQRQRIAIARAFLSSAPLIMLDEPTSALDFESEQAVTEALERLAGNHTILAIAHRLTTIRDFDKILVLDGGRIIESGTHASLLAQGGIYENLWKHSNNS